MRPYAVKLREILGNLSASLDMSENPLSEQRNENNVLYINFLDGNKYEYFGVPKNTYIKMINAESPSRFARRHIYNNFLYRSSSKLVAAE
jgi:hypothetical protein